MLAKLLEWWRRPCKAFYVALAGRGSRVYRCSLRQWHIGDHKCVQTAKSGQTDSTLTFTWPKNEKPRA